MKRNRLLLSLLFVCSILLGNIPMVYSDVGTLTISRATLPSDQTGISGNEVDITTSTGEAITFKATINYSYANANVVNFKGAANGMLCPILNITALPGAITKVTVKLPATGEFSDVSWPLRLSTEGTVGTVMAGTAIGAKTLTAPGGEISWEIDPEMDYRYFGFTLATRIDAYCESVIIEYESASTAPVVTLNDRGTTTTLNGATVTLPSVTTPAGCTENGWSFAGWSAKQTEVEAADLIAPGEYTPAADITLYAVYKQTASATGTLLLNKAALPDRSAYKSDPFDLTTSTGEDVSIVANINYGFVENGIQMNTAKGHGLYNATAMPGAITKITLKHIPDGRTPLTITWTPSLSATAAITDLEATDHDLEGQKLDERGKTITWNVDPSDNYTYFRMRPSAAGYFQSLEIEYQVSDASPVTTYDTNPNCNTPSTPALLFSLEELAIISDVNSFGEAKVTITGENLVSDVTLSVIPGALPFTVTPSSITPDADGNVNQEVTVKYTPSSLTVIPATLRASTSGTDPIEIPIQGEGRVLSLNAPTMEEPSDIECNSFILKWSLVPFADDYKVYISAAGSPVAGSPFTTTGNTYTFESLSAQVEYTYYVTACHEDVESSPSVSAKITLPACPAASTVTLNDRGEVSTLQGYKVTLPTVAPSTDCLAAGWSFAGWSAKSTGITVDDLIAAGEYEPEADITLYSVFKQTNAGQTSYDVNPECTPFVGLEVPYYQNFDNEITPDLPTGWVAYDINGDGNLWRTIEDIPGTMANVAQSKPNFLGVGQASGSGPVTSINDWVFSPMIHMVAGKSYKVSFYVKISSWYATYNLKLFVGNGQTVGAMPTEPIYNKEITGSSANSYNLVEQEFTVDATGDYSLGFWCGIEGDVYCINIDDFAVESGIPPVGVSEVFPTDESIDIPENTEVYAIFNQDITEMVKDLSLINIIGGNNVSASLVDGNKLVISHDNFPFSDVMIVNIPKGTIEGLDDYQWSFSTVSSEVEMYEHFPENGVNGVWPETAILVRFNKQVTIADDSKITIDNGATGVKPRVEGNFLYIDHDRLDRDITYTVTIAPGAITGWVGAKWSFSVVKSGTISSENAIYGPLYGMINVRHVSENGRYVTGKSGGYGPFVWDVLEGNLLYPLRNDGKGESMQASSTGIVVGPFSGEYGDTGAFWKEGKTYEIPSVGYMQGISVTTPDGSIIGGYTSIINPNYNPKEDDTEFIIAPTTWEIQEDFSVKATTWAYPANVNQGARISGLSADGKKAVGRVNIKNSDVAYSPIYWKSKDEYVILTIDGNSNLAGEFTCISDNGRYAGFRVSHRPGIIDFETNEITMLSKGDIVNAITNDGFAVAISGERLAATPYVYSKELGIMNFADYVKDYLTFLNKDLYDKLITMGNGNTLLMHISSDGKNWAIQHQDNTGVHAAFVLHIEGDIEVKPRPVDVTASVNREDRTEVELSWKAPDSNETILKYNIYANETLRGSVNGNLLTYIDDYDSPGYISYTVSAVYGDETESPRSDEAIAVIVDNYDIPFVESFESGTLEANFWTAEEWTPALGYAYGVEGTSGLMVWMKRNPGVKFSGKLISKPFNGKGTDKVFLSYMMLAYYFDFNSPEFTDDMFYVDVTTDGENWTTVDSYQPERFNNWRAEIIDLSEYVAGKLFNVRFRVEGENNLKYDNKAWLFDYITVDFEAPNGTTVPGDLIFDIDEKEETVDLAWQDPAGFYGLTYAKTSAKKSFGNEGKNLIAVHSFNKEELALYEGLSLQSISVTIAKKREAGSTAEFNTAVFVNGERVDSTPAISYEAGKLNTFPLSAPILITSDIEDLKIGIELVKHHVNEWPLGADESYSVVKGKGDLYSEDGGKTWKKLSDIKMQEEHYTWSNWSIFGNLSKEINTKDRTPYIVGYNVYRDGVKLNTDLQFRQNFVTPFVKGVYTTRAFSLETEKLSAESKGVNVSLVSIPSVDANQSVGIYPNPASLYVNIEGEYTKATLYGANGNVILIAEKESVIPVDHVPAGIYVLIVETENGSSNHKLIIK